MGESGATPGFLGGGKSGIGVVSGVLGLQEAFAQMARFGEFVFVLQPSLYLDLLFLLFGISLPFSFLLREDASQLTSLTDRLCLHHMGAQACLCELPKRKLRLHLSMVAEPLCVQYLVCI